LEDADQFCLEKVLKEVLSFIGLTDKQFDENLNIFFGDESKRETIKKVQDESKEDKGEGVKKGEFKEREAKMGKKEVIATQKVLQRITLDQIKALKTMHPTSI